MDHFVGIDLHSNNSYITVIDTDNNRTFKKKARNNLTEIIKLLAPFEKQIIEGLKALGNSEITEHPQNFFKTGAGEYGEGDVFLGIRVSIVRKCIKDHFTISLQENLDLLKSPYHEVCLLALLILVKKIFIFKKKC